MLNENQSIESLHSAEKVPGALEFFENEVKQSGRMLQESKQNGTTNSAKLWERSLIDNRNICQWLKGEPGVIENEVFGQAWLAVRYKTWNSIRFNREYIAKTEGSKDELTNYLRDRAKEALVMNEAVYQKVREEKNSIKDDLYYAAYAVSNEIL